MTYLYTMLLQVYNRV